METSLRKSGQAFREAALLRKIPPNQYGALLQDIIGETQEIKPALLDLAVRRLFQELPMKGTPGQKYLSKNQLLYELRLLYRDEIIVDLEQFIDGVLGLSMSAKSNPVKNHVTDEVITAGSFYADSPLRLFLLSVLTLGLYDLLWTYRHWRHYKKLALKSKPILQSRKNDQRIIPFWCTLFSGFYIVGASRRIKEKLNGYEIKGKTVRPWRVFIVYSFSGVFIKNSINFTESTAINVLLFVAYILTDCIRAAQPAILQNRANLILQHEEKKMNIRSLNTWDWFFISLGFVWFLLIVIGILIPPSFYDA